MMKVLLQRSSIKPSMKKCLIFVALVLLFKNGFNQSGIVKPGNIAIRIYNESNQSLGSATIEIFDGKGKNKLHSFLADSSGQYIVTVLSPGDYQLVVSYTGYQSASRQLTIPSDTKLISFNLLKSGTLEQVSITALRPLVQYQQGKTVINLDAAASNAGTTVLEVLEKSPGVTVDRNGNVTLQGKANVQIYVDGKQTYLSGTDLSNMLNSMSSAQVEQIELITSPTAKYDASGNAIIIS